MLARGVCVAAQSAGDHWSPLQSMAFTAAGADSVSARALAACVGPFGNILEIVVKSAAHR